MELMKKRTLTQSDLLKQAFWHPFVLVPLTVALFSIFFLNVYRSIGFPGLIFGVLGGIVGLIFNLLMLSLYPESEEEKKANSQDPLVSPPTFRELEEKLVILPNSDEIFIGLQRFEIILHDVREALFSTRLDPTIRRLFLPTLGQNENSALRLILRLLEIQERLNSLEESASKHGQGFDTRIEQLQNQRSSIMAHLDQLNCTLEKLATDLPQHTTDSSLEAEENLQRLKDSLNKVQQTEEISRELEKED